MKPLHKCLTIGFIALLTSPGLADEPVRSVGDLRFVIDTAGFRGQGSGSWLEIYTFIEATQLEFQSVRGRQLATIRATMTIVDSTLKPYKKRTWVRKLTAAEPKEYYESIPFRDITAVDLPPGAYGLSVTVEDLRSGIKGTAARLLEVVPLDPKLAMSDLLFAHEIGKGDEGRFDKGAWKIIPSIDRQFAIGDPLKVYFEIYNLTEGKGEAAGLVLGYRLIDLDGNVVHHFDDSRVRKPGTRAAKVAELPTDGINRGRYYLEIEAFDKASQEYRKIRRLVKLGAGSVTVTRRTEAEATAG